MPRLMIHCETNPISPDKLESDDSYMYSQQKAYIGLALLQVADKVPWLWHLLARLLQSARPLVPLHTRQPV